MRSLTILASILAIISLDAQIVPPTTIFTRDFLRSQTQAEARNKLGITGYATGEGSFTSVSTIADVASVVRTNGLPLFVQTTGFATAGDRGGAVYQWVNSSAPTNIYRIAAQGGGRWIELDYHQRWVCNVLKAGATPFDSTDDTAAFQRAFDAAMQQVWEGGYAGFGDEPTVYFPSGRYYISDTVYYLGEHRDRDNVRVVGDGIYMTRIVRTGDNPLKPTLLLSNTRLDVRNFSIASTVGTAIAPDFTRGNGIHLVDSCYGVMENISLIGLSRGLILENDAMNWNTYRGLQFEGCYINILGNGCQGSTIELHSTTSGHVFFGKNYGSILYGSYEASGLYSEFYPTAFNILSDENSTYDFAYNEASDNYSAFMGVLLTNRVTFTKDSDTVIRAWFTNVYYAFAGSTVRFIPEGSVPPDVETGIVGQRTLTMASPSTNVATFNAGNAITSDLTGIKMLMVRDMPTYTVRHVKFKSMGQRIRQDAKMALLDRVQNIELFGANANAFHATRRAQNIRAFGAELNWLAGNDYYFYDHPARHKPFNIFPDPFFVHGTNWADSISVTQPITVIPTNHLGRTALLFCVTNKPTGNALFRMNFRPMVPMSSINSQQLAVVGELKELYTPRWRPTAWTINSGGSGYVDGNATVSHGGRAVQVTLTTSGGAITGVSWHFGSFVTNTGISNLPVVQSGGSGGTISPTTFVERGLGNITPSVYLTYWNEDVPGTVGMQRLLGARKHDIDTGGVKSSTVIIATNLVDGSKTGFRFVIFAYPAGGSEWTGDEQWLITEFRVLVAHPTLLSDAYDLADGYRILELRNPVVTLPFVSDKWTSPPNSASLFAELVSGNTGVRLVNPNNIKGWVFHLLPDASSDPTGVSPGAIYYNTGSGVWRVFTGTSWRNW